MSRLQTYPKKKLPMSWIIVGLVGSIILVLSTILLILYPFPSNKFTPYFKVDHPIVFQGEVYPISATLMNNEIYVPVSFVKEKIDENILKDEKSNSIIITTKEKVLQLPTDSLTYFINEKSFSLESPVLTANNGIDYMALEPFRKIFNIHLDYQSETGALIIKKDHEQVLTANVKQEDNHDFLRLRSKPDISTSYVGNVKANEEVQIEKDVGNYYLVRKANGIAGYIKKNLLILHPPKLVEHQVDKEIGKIKKVDWPINLIWEAVYTKTPNPNDLPNIPGVNVVSPTWFKLKNGSGEIHNLGSTEYSKWAKERNYQIWGLFSNDFDPQKTHEAFKDFETRQKMIRQLLMYSQIYQLDGINIDIENVNIEDSPFITQFLREATPYFHQAGLVVSMDITFISSSENWSKFYERDKLKDIVDYLIVMAYDEHWANSPKSGSVASLPWVEHNLKELLKIVPHDRLILGIPLYTRIWKEEVGADGKTKISSTAVSMTKAEQWIKDNNITPVIDSKSGQHFAEYYDEKEQATYKVWLENDYSLQKRAQLVHKYSLAGIGSWARYFGNESAWTAIESSLNKVEIATKAK